MYVYIYIYTYIQIYIYIYIYINQGAVPPTTAQPPGAAARRALEMAIQRLIRLTSNMKNIEQARIYNSPSITKENAANNSRPGDGDPEAYSGD